MDNDGESTADSNVDGLDRRILAMVQDNNLVPHREIADVVGLSTPAVTRRLKRLRQIEASIWEREQWRR